MNVNVETMKGMWEHLQRAVHGFKFSITINGQHQIFFSVETMLKYVLHVTRQNGAFQEAYGRNVTWIGGHSIEKTSWPKPVGGIGPITKPHRLPMVWEVIQFAQWPTNRGTYRRINPTNSFCSSLLLRSPSRLSTLLKSNTTSLVFPKYTSWSKLRILISMSSIKVPVLVMWDVAQSDKCPSCSV